MMKEKFQKRFDDIEVMFVDMPIKGNLYGGGVRYDSAVWYKAAVSAQNLIKAVFRENSPHYINISKCIEECKGIDTEVNAIKGVFFASKDDFENDCVFNVEMSVSGEIFGNFTVLAKEALKEGKKEVAAVLACAALEDALKKYANANELDIDGKTMHEVVGALKTKGLVSGAQKSLLEAMPKIRNAAMHADWKKISEPDISSVIGFTEQFLLSNFS